MSEIVRFSVSMEADLLEEFDRYCKEGKFATRSEAVRQLVRETLTTHAWESDAQDAAATLTLVYDHHRTRLAERLLELQHRHTDMVVSTMHIHLDHDGATGSLARENPRLRVYVHQRGAPHMVDPAKLLASASRLFGDQMDELWGEFLPVPADQVEGPLL